MIGKIYEWSRCGEFLPLKQHWRRRRQQQERRNRLQTARAGQLVKTQAVQRVRHLIVILDESDKIAGLKIETRRPTPFPLPRTPLPLIQISAFHRRNQLLRRPTIIRIVRLAAARQRYSRAVMEIIIP